MTLWTQTRLDITTIPIRRILLQWNIENGHIMTLIRTVNLPHHGKVPFTQRVMKSMAVPIFVKFWSTTILRFLVVKVFGETHGCMKAEVILNRTICPPRPFGKRSSKFENRFSVSGSKACELTNCILLLLFNRLYHNFEEKYYEDSRVDAVAMERLTASSYVINMHGFCGLTVVQEFGGGKDLTRALDGGKMNSISKLRLAKQIAQGLRDVHSISNSDNSADDASYQHPTLVHNDINLANLLFTTDNRPVLNDFNIAKLIMTHNETGAMCSFYSHFPNPQWKAPEEQVIYGSDGKREETTPPIVNEKVDIYALGNVYYRIVTGLNPWKRPEADRLFPEEKKEVARLKKYDGALPPIPMETLKRIKSDPMLSTLLEAMRLCYRYNPNERPTAAELVHFLDGAIQTYVESKN
jgi:serine/threonine protein kinase